MRNRTMAINVRVSENEKKRLEKNAKRKRKIEIIKFMK